jgi:hypothetical protein
MTEDTGLSDFKPPDTQLCRAATEFAQRVSEPFLLNHVLRSWIYAECLGHSRGTSYDREVLYVATVLHDLGLTEIVPVEMRFEIEGADAAKEFLARQGMAEQRIELVWDAIALHTTAQIPLRKSPEVALCHLGIAHDLRGGAVELSAAGIDHRALAAYPRLALPRDLVGSLVRLYRKNPAAAASHAVADACERLVPEFRRFNLCDVLLRDQEMAELAPSAR